MNAASSEVTVESWRALVEKELAGKPFDKALVYEAFRGVAVAPLYTEAPSLDGAVRLERKDPFRVCMRHGADAHASDLVADVVGGADALWIPLTSSEAIGLHELARTSFVLEPTEVPSPERVAELAASLPSRLVVAADPIGWRARGQAPFASLAQDLEALARLAVATRGRDLPTAVVSTEPYHDAGADAAEEIAIALSTGVAYLEALLEAGLTPSEAASAIALRITVGRETFVELSKLRALRIGWGKVLRAVGAVTDRPPVIHAVCSAQTMSVRDPWVNMLRVTTQVFAAVMGGADLVTPNAFDEAFGTTSALGRRVARNTGLVLREESALGRVSDPAGGSYYFDALTDALAREAWTRFQELSRRGGITPMLESGELALRLEASWRERLDRIAKRKVPILGVTEFANLGEVLPHAAPLPATSHGGLPIHRDAAVFEELRLRADSAVTPPEVMLLALGTFAESRARAGFATNFFGAGGIRTREGSEAEVAPVVCLCGTDERYAEEAASRATSLKRAGTKRVLVAGRPGPHESAFRAAGVDGFIFVGCDAVASLGELLSLLVGAAGEGAT